MEHRLIVECFADTLLMRLIRKQQPQHAKGVDEVLKQMDLQFNRNKTPIVIGVVDNDKKKWKIFDQEYPQIVSSNRYFDIRKHKERNYFIIVIKQAHEDFVIRSAESVGVDNPKYKTFRDRKSLQKISKNVNIEDNKLYVDFLNTINQKNAPAFREIELFLTQHLGPVI